MQERLSRDEFAVVIRRSGVALTSEDIDELYQGYGLFEEVVKELQRPTAIGTDQAVLFAAEGGQCR